MLSYSSPRALLVSMISLLGLLNSCLQPQHNKTLYNMHRKSQRDKTKLTQTHILSIWSLDIFRTFRDLVPDHLLVNIGLKLSWYVVLCSEYGIVCLFFFKLDKLLTDVRGYANQTTKDTFFNLLFLLLLLFNLFSYNMKVFTVCLH